VLTGKMAPHLARADAGDAGTRALWVNGRRVTKGDRPLSCGALGIAEILKRTSIIELGVARQKKQITGRKGNKFIRRRQESRAQGKDCGEPRLPLERGRQVKGRCSGIAGPGSTQLGIHGEKKNWEDIAEEKKAFPAVPESPKREDCARDKSPIWGKLHQDKKTTNLRGEA